MPVLSNFKGSWWSQTILHLGPLKVWWNGEDKRSPITYDSSLYVEWRGELLAVVRFGRYGWRPFSERYQGQNGIPVRWRYYLGNRVSVRLGPR